MRYALITALTLIWLPIEIMGQSGADLEAMYGDGNLHILAPGVISTKLGEYSPTLDTSGNELYFMRRTPGIFDYTIFTSTLVNKQWSQPAIAPFSGNFRDAAPYLSPDGGLLLFDSRRPDPTFADNSINLWYVKRTSEGWSEARKFFEPSKNSPDEPDVGRDEFGPAMDAEGNLYFYSFRRPYRGGAHYLSLPPDYQQVILNEELPDPSAATFVSYAYISPDGRIALLEGRAQDRNDRDIFCSCKDSNGVWGPPREMKSINSRYYDGVPTLSLDGNYLLFASNREVERRDLAYSNLYIIKAEELLMECKRPRD